MGDVGSWFKNEQTGEETFIKEKRNIKPPQYSNGIDTFKRAEANMSIEGIMAATVLTVDAYIWRDKGTDLEDFKKARDWLDWCISVVEKTHK